MANFYKDLKISALDAISEAQKIVNGPILFQCVFALVEHNVLQVLSDSKEPLSLKQIADRTQLSEYGLSVLLDMAAAGRVVTVNDEGLYTITKIGMFFIGDKMTAVNLKFIKHICYQGMDSLAESVKNLKPEGLKVFSEEYKTIYPHLSELPPKAKDAWFGWDHFYSQSSFTSALKIIMEKFNPKSIYDVGGNTGNFAILAAKSYEDVHVTILDLPSQIETANERIKAEKLEDRVSFNSLDILTAPTIPADADLFILSQFLDCFAKEHVNMILSKIAKNMNDDSKVCILEPIADRQKFEASSYSILAGSVYFNNIANGYSKFFSTKEMTSLIEEAGLKIDEIVDNLGICTSLFICSKAK